MCYAICEKVAFCYTVHSWDDLQILNSPSFIVFDRLQ